MNIPVSASSCPRGCDLTPPAEVDVDALCPGRQVSRMRLPGEGAGWPIRRHPGRGHRPGHPLLLPPITVRCSATGQLYAASGDPVMAIDAANTLASALWTGAGVGPGQRSDADQRIRLDHRYAGERRWPPPRADARPAGGQHSTAAGRSRSGAPVRGGDRPSATSLGVAAVWFHCGHASPAIALRSAAHGGGRRR